MLPFTLFYSGSDTDTVVDYLKAEFGIKPAGSYFSDPSSSSSNGRPIGLDFHSYEKLGHTITDEEVEDIRKFLKSVFSEPAGST